MGAMWKKESKKGSEGNNSQELIISINQNCNELWFL